MTNEVSIVELYGPNNNGDPRRYTIADATAVSKGTLLQLNDNRTVVATTGASTAFAGVAAEEHKPNLGITSISALTDCVVSGVASGGLTAGWAVAGDNNNNFVSAALVVGSPLIYGAGTLGYVLNTATNGQTAYVRIHL